MIVLGLPRTPGDLRFALASLVQCLDLNPVIECQISVMCCQGSATPFGVISITTTYEVLRFQLELGNVKLVGKDARVLLHPVEAA